MQITWKIINLEWIEEVAGNQKVVTNVHYWVDAVDTDGNMGYSWGNIQLNISNLTNFTDFSTLTEAQCIEWVKTEINNQSDGQGVQAIETWATQMCQQQDPMRKRGFGVPW